MSIKTQTRKAMNPVAERVKTPPCESGLSSWTLFRGLTSHLCPIPHVPMILINRFAFTDNKKETDEAKTPKSQRFLSFSKTQEMGLWSN